jgi:hypothetical protein
MMEIIKALIGLILIFIVHIPRIVYRLLLLSYARAFDYQENLTADPKVHLKPYFCAKVGGLHSPQRNRTPGVLH